MIQSSNPNKPISIGLRLWRLLQRFVRELSEPRPPAEPRIDAFELEPRVLYDAAPWPIDLDPSATAQADLAEEWLDPLAAASELLEAFTRLDELAEQEEWDSLSAPKVHPPPSLEPLRSEIVFIDSSLPDLDQLVRFWDSSDYPGLAYTIVLVGSPGRGLDFIGDFLAESSDQFSAVHLVTHGYAGGVQIGSTTLTAETLGHYADELASWRAHLTEGADLLLYGCWVAYGMTGQSFIEQLAQLTELDVAASTNATGSSLLGGDWHLEHHLGVIDPSRSLSFDNSWSHLLINAAPVLDTGATPTMGSGLEGATNPSGITVSDLVIDGSINDANGPVEAIAIRSLNTSLGTWQFSLNGGTSWLAIDSAQINSQTNELALLLGPTAQIRLIPFGDLNGTLSDAITFRAWDQTSGSEGQYTVITDTGGSTAFSTDTETASITVTAINDAPTYVIGEGKLTTALGSGSEEGTSVTLQADGKILVAGYLYNGSNSDFALVRYNSDGSLDTSFDGDGKVTTAVGSGSGYGWSVTLQADGKILVAGYSHNGSDDDFALVRYNSDGSLDTSFDGDGKVTTAVGSGSDYGYSVTLQADGKILVAGYGRNGSDDDFALVRYNSDGSLDTSFDGDGKVLTAIGSGHDGGYSVTLQADGKILVAGNSHNGSNYDIALVRYNSDGSLDTSFDGDGKLTTAVGSGTDYGYGVTVQVDGKILVAGYSVNGSRDLALVRYNSDGSLDTSFDGDGKVTTAVGTGVDAFSVALQADGKILVAGYIYNGSDYEFAVVRYNSDGSLDNRFDGDGIVTTAGGWGYSVTVQADGKILVAGGTFDGATYGFAAVRYNSDGSLDTSFNLRGSSLGGSVNYTENGSPVVLDSDAQIFDADLTAANNFSGATLTLTRNGGANSEDVFSATGTLSSISAASGNLVVGGTTIGTYTNTGGTLVLTFNSSATHALVNSAMQQIAYANSSNDPPTSVQIDWTFSDGNTGDQGTDGDLTATGSTTVNITSVNEAPVLDTGASPTLGMVLEGATNPSGVTVASLVVDGSITDPDGTAVEAIAVTALNTSLGTWQYSLDGGSSWLTIQADLLNSSTNELALLLGPTAQLRLIPLSDFNGSVSNAITLRAWDQTSGSEGQYTTLSSNGGTSAFSTVSDTASITITAVNDIPIFLAGDGKITSEFGYSADIGYSVAVQADGKSLVAGSSYKGSNWEFAVVRYNADGSLDTSFDGDGKVTTAIGSADDRGYSVALQADGKILVAGYSNNGSNDDFALVRYNVDGSLDTSFDGDGKVTTAIGSSHGYAQSVTVQSDGKILVAGYIWNGSNYDSALVRYNSDGTLDTSFDGDGKVITAIGSGNDYARSVTVQSDGKILVAGSTWNGTNSDSTLVRYNSDGTFDTSFDGDGMVTTAFGSGNDYAQSVTVQSDGKILVAGSAWNGTNSDFALVRYNSDGSLDTGFDNDGKLTTAIGEGYAIGYGVTVQADGKILVAGHGNSDFALVRYNNDGSLDTSFDEDGKVTTAIGSGEDNSYSVALQSDGKILVGGSSDNGSNSDFALVRYNSDGSLDRTFNLATALAGEISFIENGAAVVLGSNVSVLDAELSISDFSGASLTLVRHGGASAQDLFSATGTLGALTQGGNLTVGGTTIGTVSTNSGGMLVLSFNSNATNSLVNSAMQQIAYANSSDAPPIFVQIDWTFSDGNSGSQGSGGALTVTGNCTVTITRFNDAPVAASDTATAVEAGGHANGTAGTNPTGNVLTNDTDPDHGIHGSVTSIPVPTASPGRTVHEVRNEYAFAVLRSDGTVVTWGSSNFGGDSSSVATQLTGVQQIYSTQYAFAALKSDGTVVTWGNGLYGGDSSSVAAQLTGVQQIFSNQEAFAALKSDGTVVTWGNSGNGGDSSSVAAQLTGVQQIYSTASSYGSAFAALKSDGSVVTWGDSYSGGDSSSVAAQLTGVQQIYSTQYAFAALKSDGTVVTWGDSYSGGDSSSVAAQLTGVQQIYSTSYAFAALKSDSTVVTWGDGTSGGDSSSVAAQLTGVQQIHSTSYAFAALKSDGSVVTWGDSYSGGDSSSVAAQLTGVQQIHSTSYAFAALKSDGTVVTWGDGTSGGDSSGVAAQLTGVLQIYSSSDAFAALKSDGTVVTWGNSYSGGDSSSVAAQLTGVQQIYSTSYAFAALKSDGTVVTWGDGTSGGDSSGVAAQLVNIVSAANPFANDNLLPASQTVTGVAAGTVGSASTHVGSNVSGTYGSINIGANGAYTYTVDNSNAAVQALRTSADTLTDVFTYTMRDAAGLTSTTQITIMIEGANDAPYDLAGTLTVDENSAGGTSVGTMTRSDVDSGDGATYSLVDDAGGRFAINSSTGQVTVANSSLLDFEAASSHNITVRVTDAVGASFDKVLTVNVTNINDAPILDPAANPTLGLVLEGATNPSGVIVADLVVDGSITVQDGAPVEAIAITELNTSLGTWQFSLDGGTSWRTIQSALLNSQTNELALLLGPTAQLRLIPFGDLNGSLSDAITFRAWDMTSGSEGQYTVISSTAEDSPFSTATDTASLTVTAVNDAPTFFSGDGIVTTAIGTSTNQAYSVTLQPDGKVLLGGYIEFNGIWDFALARYNADGSLDTTFGTGGLVTTEVGTSTDQGYSVSVQPDGKILLGGLAWTGSAYDFALVRYNADGSLDNTFGTSGRVTTSISAGNDFGYSVTVQLDGKIVLGGHSEIIGGTWDFTLVRYNANGSLDTSFGTGGRVITGIGTEDDHSRSVTIQPDGKIVVAGYTETDGTWDFALVRYNVDGSLDTSFGTGGRVTTANGTAAIGAPFWDCAISVSVQPDGKILLGGYTEIDYLRDFSLIRYNADGSLDTTFGTGGQVTTEIHGGDDIGQSVAVQRDGKIVLGGSPLNGGYEDFALVRYNPDGSLDTTFGTGGRVTTDIATGGDRGYSVTVQPDGKIVFGGFAAVGNTLDFALVRYNSDGSLDTTFDLASTLGGTVAYTEGGSPVVLDSDIRIFDSELSAAYFFNGATLTLVRNGGANSHDLFTGTGTLGTLTQGSTLTVDGTAIGWVNTNSAGTLVLTFDSSATNALVNSAMQQIAYANSSDNPPASVQIDWLFNDANNFEPGEQGTGGALTATGSITVNITAVNDAPVASDDTFTTHEDTAVTFDVRTNDSDVDNESLTVTQINGTSIVVGGSVNVVGGTVTLNADGTLTFAPNNDYAGTPSFTYTISDGSQTATATVYGTITAINDAPILDPAANPTLGLVLEGATNPSGVTVAELVVDGSITDQDGAPVEAIAITGLNTSLGTWQYSLNGGTSWLTIDANLINNTTNELALLLGPTAQLRLIPFGDLNGSVSDGITFRAWDQTSGSEGQYTVISSTGGTSAFSSATDTASITVTAVNDAPTFFSGDGIVTTPIGTLHDWGYSVTVQPDGKFLVGGYARIGTTDDFALVRYNTDGSLDTSFGTGGMVTTAIGTWTDWAQSLTIQPDGKIVVGGYASMGSNHDFALVRYNANGSLDTTFGTGGIVTTAIGTSADVGRSVTIQPDGKLVVGGYASIGSNNDFALVRYNANGTLDTSFGTGGMVTTVIGTGTEQGRSVTIQPDGKIVVGGHSNIGGNDDFALVRYNANGTLDTSFGTGGMVTTAIGTSTDQGYSVTIQPDGKIVVGGYAMIGINSDFALVRYNANGTLDNSFGTGGMVTTAIGTSTDQGYSVTIQPDGKIVVGGSALIGSTRDFALVRYNANGTLDTTFGTGGMVTTAIGTGMAQGISVTIQPDGKIVVGGYAMIGSNNDFALVRYNADGTLDPTFDLASTLGGTVSYTENGSAVVLDSNVRIFDAELSAANNFSGATLTLARNGGANGQDLFSATGTLGALTQGSNLVVDGTTIGSVTTNSSGTLVLTFNSSATGALVNSAMQQIAYANSSEAPPASVQIDWTFNDNNGTAQGTGGALTATGNVTVNITSVNDAPTITGGYTHSLTGTNEDTNSSGTLASALLAGASWADVDSGVVSGLAITGVTGSGTWQYSTDGSTWANFGAVSGTNALLISSTTQVRYIPNGVSGETATLTYKAWDQTSGTASTNATPSYATTASSGGTTAFSSNDASAQIIVSSLNDAPVLNTSANPTLGTVLEGATNPSGVTVASLVVDGSITDADGSAVEAIAITGLNTSLGTWQYSLNGGTNWLTIDANLINNTTNELALLLGPTAQLRLIPFGDLNGSVSDGITFRAWDQTSGSEGQYAVISSTGGTSAFSSATDTASITVTAINDAPTFLSGDGIVTTDFNAGTDQGSSVTVQPDGKILVAGYAWSGISPDFGITRYNADGSLDSSFGTGGMVTTAIGTGTTDEGRSITIQPDGKIVVGGYSLIGGNWDFALVRYNANGTLDTSFGTGGLVMTAFGTSADQGYSVTLQPDGKLVVGGYASIGSNNDFALVRYNANGTLDTSFGIGGMVTTAIVAGTDQGRSVTIQPDGKIIVAGYASNGSNNDFALVRYNADGTLDTSFGTAGMVTTAIGTGTDQGNSVMIQPDGKIVVAGYIMIGINTDFALVRYNANGTLDTSFGTGGMVTTAIGTGSDIGYSVTTQPDGKILVGGYARIGSTNDFALVRYNADGSLDASFGTGGEVTTAVGTGADVGYSVTVQPDGKIVLTGYCNNGSNDDFALVRYNSDGSLDTRFDLAATLGGSVNYTENGSPIVLDGDVQIFDAELTAANNFSGSTLTLARNGGANTEDLFRATGTLSSITAASGDLIVGGTTIGTYTNSSGTLAFTFNNSATNTLVNSALQQIAYANSSDAPPASVQIDWTFSDGNTGDQGTDGAISATGNVIVNIMAVNDAPIAISDTATAVEAGGVANNGPGVSPGGNVLTNDTDVDAGDTKTITGVAAGIVGSASTQVGSSVTGTYGSITIGADGNYTYTVDNSNATVQALRTSADTLQDVFTYTMRDTAGLTSTTQLTITIEGANDAPHDLSGTLSVNENSASGTSVGTITHSDVDSGDGATFSLVDDAGGRFAISSSTGVVTVANSSLLDREADASHAITIRVTDSGGATYDEVFLVTLHDVDEFDVSVPTDTDAAVNEVDENVAIGTTVGITANSFDLDATTNTITYSLTSNPDGLFAIDVNTGVVTTAAAINRELVGSTHSITVQATSSDGSFATQTFTIAINDLDEFDVSATGDTNAAANSVAENAANGTVVGITASASDADATTNTITYSLDDNAGGRFAINSSTGVVTVTDGSLLDYESATSHNLTIRATSADGSFSTQSFTIALTDVDEFDITPVTDSNPAANAVDENAVNGTSVGISATAADFDSLTDSVTYALINDAGGRFAINSLTGEVTVASGAILNREAAASHEVIIRATSTDGSYSEQTFTIQVNDLDEFDASPIIDLNPQDNSLQENLPAGSATGLTAWSSDSDATNNQITYSLTDDDGGRFAIDPQTGSVTTNRPLDREADGPNRQVIVRATSADGSYAEQSFLIQLGDLDEVDVTTPVDLDHSPNSVQENASAGATVGITAGAVDADATTNSVNYSLVDDDGGRFAINTSTGAVSTTRALDRETEGAQRQVRVRATSADGSIAEETFLIAIEDTNEHEISELTDLDPATNQVAENAALGSTVGLNLRAVDLDSTGSLVSYELLNNAGGRFAIDSATGSVTVAGPLDYESATEHTLVIRARSEDASESLLTVTVQVLPLNDNLPQFDSPASYQVGEHQLEVGTVFGSDADLPAQTLSYTISGGPDAAHFRLDSSSGELRLVNLLDYEQPDDADGNGVYEVLIRISDGELFTERLVQMALVDENDQPIAQSDFWALDEDTILADSVTANDFDADRDGLGVELLEAPSHAGSFTLNSDGTFHYQPQPDYHGSDSFRYRIADGRGGVAESVVSLEIRSVNDAPISAENSFAVMQGATLEAVTGVLFNDEDIDGDPLIAILITPPTRGTLRFEADGSFVYEPERGFIGTDSFSYVASDGLATGAPTTVLLQVNVGSTSPPTSPPPSGENLNDQGNGPDEHGSVEDSNSTDNELLAPGPLSASTAASNGTNQSTGRGTVSIRTDSEPANSMEPSSDKLEDALPGISAAEFELEADLLASAQKLQDLVSDQTGHESEAEVVTVKLKVGGRLIDVAFNRKQLWEQLAYLEQQLEQNRLVQNDSSIESLGTELGAATMAASLGYILWFLRGSTMMATLFTQVPAWKMIDPLVILDSKVRHGTTDFEEQDQLNSYFENANIR